MTPSAYNLYFFNKVVNQIDTSVIDKRYVKSIQVLMVDEEDYPISLNTDDLVNEHCKMNMKSTDLNSDNKFLDYKVSSIKAYIDIKLLTMDVTDTYNEFIEQLYSD